jgi:hypothetical protein
MTTITIKGRNVHEISDQFIAKMNSKGHNIGRLVAKQYYEDNFYSVHDCIHFFAGLGISNEDEEVVEGIDTYMRCGTFNSRYSRKVSSRIEKAIKSLKKQGVFDELQVASNHLYNLQGISATSVHYKHMLFKFAANLNNLNFALASICLITVQTGLDVILSMNLCDAP